MSDVCRQMIQSTAFNSASEVIMTPIEVKDLALKRTVKTKDDLKEE
jgi:hypothetical protein